MKIKYSSKKTSLWSLIVPVFFAIVPALHFWLMAGAGCFGNGMLGIIEQAFKDDAFVGFIFLFIVFVLPVISVVWFVNACVARKNEYEKLYSGIYLKEVELLDDKVNFCFFRPEYDFKCSYSDIKKTELVVTTGRCRTKHGYTYIIEGFSISFDVLNGKTFVIPTLNKWYSDGMGFIYKFIDCVKGKVGKFDYDAIGSGKNVETKEKIYSYIKEGYQRNYAPQELDYAKFGGITLFVIGSIIMFFMREFFTAVGVSMGFWIFIPLILPCSFMFASAYMDYKIHRDMVRDSKSNKKQYYIFKLKPYQMIIVKILLAIEIVRLVLP